MKSDIGTKSASFFLHSINKQRRKWVEKYGEVGNNFITILDSQYPQQLCQIYDPPLFLFYKGNLDLLKEKNLLTVVGSRKISAYHVQSTQSLISSLAPYNFVISSGLAYGIDTISHTAAISAKMPTIAVLGSGLGQEVLYPRANINLANDIIQSGGLLLSEHPDCARPELHFFPKRNRILSAISRATAIISGAEKSGTLITAQCALDQGRDVLALPGNINQKLSQGPNQLIKNGAIPLLSPEDILNIFGLEAIEEQQKLIFKSQDDAKIFSVLQIEPLNTEQLSRKTGWSFGKVNTCVSRLEMAGFIYLNHHNQFEIK